MKWVLPKARLAVGRREWGKVWLDLYLVFLLNFKKEKKQDTCAKIISWLCME